MFNKWSQIVLLLSIMHSVLETKKIQINKIRGRKTINFKESTWYLDRGGLGRRDGKGRM